KINPQAHAKNRDHPRIMIKDGLAGAVGAGVTQRDRGEADLFSPEQHEPLLIDFGKAVNGFATDGCVLGSRSAFGDCPANWAMDLPIAATQLLDRTHARKDQTVFRTLAGALAVNCWRGRDDA